MDHLIFVVIMTIIIIAMLGVSVFILMRSLKQAVGILDAKRNEAVGRINEQLEIIEKTFIDEIQEITNIHERSSLDAKNKDRALFDTFVKLRDAIKESCLNTMHKTQACRLAVYLLHNGNSSTHGVRFFKMSCICEKVAIGSGIREQSVEHSNIPINLFDEMLDKLIDNGRYIVMNDDGLEEKNHRIFISGSKIKYAQAIAIFDYSNNILGFVLAEMEHSYDRDLALKEKEKIDALVNQLVPILSYSEYAQTAIEKQDVRHD